MQVLEGNNTFYVGALTSEDFVNKGIKGFVKDSDLSENQILLPTQPHITIVPPSNKISPSLVLKQVVEIKPFELEFDRVSISTRGNINLWGKESDNNCREVSTNIAGALGVEQNTRDVHTKIGILPEDQVDLIFAHPEEFGFEREEGNPDRLFKKLDSPIKQQIDISKKDYPAEQVLLKVQCEGATPVSDEEIIKSKEAFRKRVDDIKVLQETIKNVFYEYADLPYQWNKLTLAIEGDPHSGRVPLTFSCRENGIQLWREFCDDINKVVAGTKYDDVTIQMLGSGVHGFSRNPSKKLKGWSSGSDGDLAIFSKKMSLDSVKQGVQVNEGIQLNGKFVLFKNERSSLREGMGFYDTNIGQQFRMLQEKWSKKLYGKDRALGVEIDFKLNISPEPFRDAINVIVKSKERPQEEK